MKILFVASECVPFCKTGGLADVVGTLPAELRKRRHDVRVILPKYKTIRSQEFGIKETGESIQIPMGQRVEKADIRVAKTDKGVKVYFVNHDGFFGRAGLYRTFTGDYADNGERFAFFSRAVFETCKAMEFRPDIISCHDWQTGLVPAYLKTVYREDAFFQHTSTVMTIHNMAYQGIFPKTLLPQIGLGWEEFTIDKLEYYDQINYLKAGLTYSTLLSTVSPTYSHQIQNSYEFGCGLEGTLRKRAGDLVGILNGLSPEEWTPEEDPFLPKTYTLDSLSTRKDCKAFLQRELKLPADPSVSLLAMVARLDRQKGIDLLIQNLQAILALNTQVVVLGQGDIFLQGVLEQFERIYPLAFRVRSDFNDPLAHHIYGGCDIFMMPSRFEPCGIGQLIAMRYGAVPVAANTGGLRDTITPVGRNSGTGFLFEAGHAPSFLGAIQEALRLFSDKESWALLQRRAMSTDFSWDVSAQTYLHLFWRALGRGTKTRASTKRIS
ncbi:MAG: glycogen synthase GlgA [Elusimicrobiota bacterium]